MKKRTLIAACLLAAMSANAESQVSGIDKKNMNLNVKPGTDFYQYAAGGWLKSHPLDAEHTNNGAFTDLYEENQKRIQELILEYASKPQKKGTLEQKIGTFYNMLMDSVRLNREGWEPLKPTLARIAAVKSNKEYQLVTAELDRRGEGTMMFGIGVGADMRNASMNIVAIGQGGLGLGTRDYYLNDKEGGSHHGNRNTHSKGQLLKRSASRHRQELSQDELQRPRAELPGDRLG